MVDEDGSCIGDGHIRDAIPVQLPQGHVPYAIGQVKALTMRIEDGSL